MLEKSPPKVLLCEHPQEYDFHQSGTFHPLTAAGRLRTQPQVPRQRETLPEKLAWRLGAHAPRRGKQKAPSTRRHARQHLCPEVLVSPQRTPESGRLRRTFSHNIAAKSSAHGQGASFGARFSHSAGYMLRQSRKTLVRALYIRSRASSLQQ